MWWGVVWLTVDVALGVERSGETEASRKQADSMRAQSIRVCILSGCMEGNMEVWVELSFLLFLIWKLAYVERRQ